MTSRTSPCFMSRMKFLKMKPMVRPSNNCLGQTASSFTWDLFSAMGVVFSVNNFDRITALYNAVNTMRVMRKKWSGRLESILLVYGYTCMILTEWANLYADKIVRARIFLVIMRRENPSSLRLIHVHGFSNVFQCSSRNGKQIAWNKIEVSIDKTRGLAD